MHSLVIQRILRFRHDRIRRQEVTQRRVIPAGVVKVQPQHRLLPLPGETAARRRRPRREASGAEGPVAHLARLRRPAEDDRCAAEMVIQQPKERPAAAQGNALAMVLFRSC
jgi:hypothetical protein